MKITIENTSKVVRLDGVPARVWVGETDSGVPVHCYVALISPQTADPAETARFEAELVETCPPSAAVEAIPLRMIL